MTRGILVKILDAVAVGALVACGPAVIDPTPSPAPTSTPLPTETPSPTITFTPTVTPSATVPPPSATHTRLPAPTRAPATATPTQTRAPLTPLVWDARLDALNVQFIPATVEPGQAYWRLVKAEFWDEKENQGKHHIYVNVLDENGARIVGQNVIVKWPDERLVIVTEDKPAPEYSANFPLDVNHYPPWGTLGAFAVWVDDLPSDQVAGMGLPPKNKFVVYLLTFQRTAQ